MLQLYLEVVPVCRKLSLVHRPKLCQIGVLWADDAIVHPHLLSPGATVRLGGVAGAQLLDAIGVTKRVKCVLT
jgi:hypothetical protein